MLRPILDSDVSETFESLEKADLNYLLKLNEALDMRDYLKDLAEKQADNQ